MHGKLFARDFLDEGVWGTLAWRELTEERLAAFRAEVERLFAAFPVGGTPNEPTTEQDLILPVLRSLGWDQVLPQQTTSGASRIDVPDLLLFRDAAAKATAQIERHEALRYRHGSTIVESKRWQRPLDRGESTEVLDPGAPSTQMLRYLSRADVASDGGIRWGVLTNGRLWRLYWQGARSRSEEFFELDLAMLAGAGVQPEIDAPEASDRDHYLKLFFLIFRREAFLPVPGDPEGRSFHELAQSESRQWEERVSEDLGGLVFEQVFPKLLQSLIAHDPQAPKELTADYLEEVRRAGLTFLYRLLFVLYAEDRALLPAHEPRYDDYSLSKIRREIAARLDRRDALSGSASRYAAHLRDLFAAIGEGDPAIGLPPYDGGLFESGGAPLLNRVRLPDADLAPLIDALSRREDAGRRRLINYRDLSVQHLGSIYERLLQFEPVVGADRRVTLQPNVFARKGSGSYYTHDDLVRLILAEAIGPLVQEKIERFRATAERLKSDRRPRETRLDELRSADAANAILELKVCDPAMGSGHFLVSLVDYLADQVLEFIATAPVEVSWGAGDHPYRSPMEGRIEAIRRQISASAAGEGWNVDPAALDDRHIVRRIILKRVIHGVDKNLMAVELAKVALWLHTFTAGAPLSFLDHHLRCGDSLYGEWLDEALEDLRAAGALFAPSARIQLGNAARGFAMVAEISDSDIGEVRQSAGFFQEAEQTLGKLHKLLDFWHALWWISPASRGRGRASEQHPGVQPLLRGTFGDLLEAVDAGHVETADTKLQTEAVQANDLLGQAEALAARERFLHWELAFPTVWQNIANSGRNGGFDAVIGNPPWDRMKLQEVEWFAARQREIAMSTRAADRKRRIEALAKRKDPLWEKYILARDTAEAAARIARDSGEYPMLSRGDLNVYSLFVERASGLVRARGMVGLLVPSGIASDLSAAEFFRSVATSGRLRALYDFENKKVFFPDVHASFKFSVFVFGGPERRFDEARCAFFLHHAEELNDPDRSFPLGPEDFRAVNPNTGTAPIFRSRQDAQVTTEIYRRFPVLIDRSAKIPKAAWPIDYVRMFDMTNDSALFKTAAELDEMGFYRVAANRWRKGREEYVPLYEGKMVQMYDHRAASVKLFLENMHRPAQPEGATPEQHADPQWLPEPQYWIPANQLTAAGDLAWCIAFKDVTAPTNIRTMIAAAVPLHGLGNTLPAFLPAATDRGALTAYRGFAPLLLANLNSFAFDYLARQKVQGQHLNLYIVEQLPVIPLEHFDRRIGSHLLSDFVREQVLRLTYTAADMEPFARDLGYPGSPFPWDEEERRHRLARLDALFFHLHGILRDETSYILDQFPGVQEDDERRFGRYLTRELILAYMNAVAAGDLDSVVELPT